MTETDALCYMLTVVRHRRLADIADPAAGDCSLAAMSTVERHYTAPPQAARVSWRGENADRATLITGYAILVLTWIRNRNLAERRADVETPHGMLVPPLLCGVGGAASPEPRLGGAHPLMLESRRRSRPGCGRATSAPNSSSSCRPASGASHARATCATGARSTCKRAFEGLTRWRVRLTTISASSASAGSGRRPGRR